MNGVNGAVVSPPGGGPANAFKPHVQDLETFNSLPNQKDRTAVIQAFITAHYTVTSRAGQKDEYKCNFCKEKFTGSQVKAWRHFLPQRLQLEAGCPDGNKQQPCSHLNVVGNKELDRAKHFANIHQQFDKEKERISSLKKAGLLASAAAAGSAGGPVQSTLGIAGFKRARADPGFVTQQHQAADKLLLSWMIEQGLPPTKKTSESRSRWTCSVS